MTSTWPGLPALPRRRRALLIGAAVVVLGYVGYRAYRSDTLAAWRRALKRLAHVLDSASGTLNSGAELTGSVFEDVKTYLDSDTPDLPPRLRQLVHLVQSEEVSMATSQTVAALWTGLQQAGSGHKAKSNPTSSPDALDRILSAVLSERGQSLVSLAVALGARNLVEGLYKAWSSSSSGEAGPGAEPDVLDRLLGWLGTQHGQRAARRLLATFASSGVGVYCDKTADINIFDQLLTAVSARKEHLSVAKICLTVLARETVRTAIVGRDAGKESVTTGFSPSSSASSLRSADHESASGTRQRSLATLERLASLHDIPSMGAVSNGELNTKAADSGNECDVPSCGSSPRSIATPPMLNERPREVVADSSTQAKSATQPTTDATTSGWVGALSSCFLAMARDSDGRALVADAAGAAAREAVSIAGEMVCQRTVAVFLAVAFMLLLVLQILARLVSAALF